MLEKAGFTFKYSEKSSKGGGVSSGFDNGMTKEEIQIRVLILLTHVWGSDITNKSAEDSCQLLGEVKPNENKNDFSWF